jgi:hypothetical protein
MTNTALTGATYDVDDWSSGDSATTATGQASSRPLWAMYATSSTTARPSATVEATTWVRMCRPACQERFRWTNCRTFQVAREL